MIFCFFAYMYLDERGQYRKVLLLPVMAMCLLPCVYVIIGFQKYDFQLLHDEDSVVHFEQMKNLAGESVAS